MARTATDNRDGETGGETKIAIVGMGKIARDQHVPEIAASPAFSLAATVDPAARLADWQPSAPAPRGGYAQIFHDHVQGADTGADFDFLIGCRGADVGKDSH